MRGKGQGSIKGALEGSSLGVSEDGDDISKNRDYRGEKQSRGKMPGPVWNLPAKSGETSL